MPLHLNSIMSESNRIVFMQELPRWLNDCKDVFVSMDRRIFHLTKFMLDEKRKKNIGKYVFTILKDERNKSLNIIDIDLTLFSDNAVPVKFLERLSMSSDANEYYNAETLGTGQHFQLETVNRHTVSSNLEGAVQNVHLSAFPFKLGLYDTMDDFNASIGFDKEVQVGNTDLKVGGLSDMFLAPGNAVNPNVKDDETFSFVIGAVKSFRDVSIQLNHSTAGFTIILLETALGLLPTAASREIFDIKNLHTGKIVAMCADIKADFVKMKYPDCV